MSGWVKLHRKAIENGWLKNHNMWIFWTYCLLKASHKRHKHLVGFRQIELAPGQFVFGRKIASIETGLSEQAVRTCLENFKKLGNITSTSTNKYTLVTIVNWGLYQDTNQETNQQPNQKVTSNQPAGNQQVTTNKNVRMKECKNKERGGKKFTLPSIDEISSYMKKLGIPDHAFMAERFFHFYQAKGWMIGKNKMKNWKSACVTWKKREPREINQLKEIDSVDPDRLARHLPEEKYIAFCNSKIAVDDVREFFKKNLDLYQKIRGNVRAPL